MSKIADTDLIINPDGSVYHLGLLPENVSDTIIAVGDPDRVERVTRHFDAIEFRKRRREFVTHTGRIGQRRISVISTGIGTDNVEIFFNEIDALFNIDLATRVPKETLRQIDVIRIGTSGALQEDIPIDAHLVSDYAVGLDNLMSFYEFTMHEPELSLADEVLSQAGLTNKPYVVRGDEDLRKKIGEGMLAGNTVTCPGFYGPQGRALRIPIRYPKLLDSLANVNSRGIQLTNFEMETSGYFAWARLLGHRAASVNAILANRIRGTFSRDPEKVMDNLIQRVLQRI